MHPRLIVVAGPSGSGKSTAFPVYGFGCDGFNLDDRAAQLNPTSFLHVSADLRAMVNRELREFVEDHIARRTSCALETTLRAPFALEMGRLAREAGFQTIMIYVALATVEENIRRVQARAQRGGHSAAPETIRRIHAGSLANLTAAIREFDTVEIYDNTIFDSAPEFLMQVQYGRIVWSRESLPEWLASRTSGFPRAVQ